MGVKLTWIRDSNLVPVPNQHPVCMYLYILCSEKLKSAPRFSIYEADIDAHFNCQRQSDLHSAHTHTYIYIHIYSQGVNGFFLKMFVRAFLRS